MTKLTYWDVLERDGAVSRIGANALHTAGDVLRFTLHDSASHVNVAAFGAGEWRQAHRIDENGQFTNRQMMAEPGGKRVMPPGDADKVLADKVLAEAHPADDLD